MDNRVSARCDAFFYLFFVWITRRIRCLSVADNLCDFMDNLIFFTAVPPRKNAVKSGFIHRYPYTFHMVIKQLSTELSTWIRITFTDRQVFDGYSLIWWMISSMSFFS